MENHHLISIAELALQYLALRAKKLTPKSFSESRRAVKKAVNICSSLYPGVSEFTSDMIEIIVQHAKLMTADKRIHNEIKKFCLWINHGCGEIKPLYQYREKKIPLEKRLHSAMSELIIEYIRRKRSVGYLLANEGIYIHFDNMLATEFPTACTVTREIALRWVEKAQEGNVCINTAINSIGAIRQLCLYIREYHDPKCYVIQANLAGSKKYYRGHIITDKELKSFFKKADSLKYNRQIPYRHLTAPVAFRIMYACGLRVSEIRILKRDDVDLVTGVIKIRESKAHAVRTVVMHQDMIEVMQHYDAEIEKTIPGREWFFVDRNDGPQLNNYIIGHWFNMIWNSMEIDEEIKEPKATARDFRHLYALTVINRWVSSGKDPAELEPWLVCYMGHMNFRMTSYYIHLAESFAPDFEKISKKATGDLFDDLNLNELTEVPYDL